MKTDLERDDFLVLLEKLKSEDDKEILSAARDINAKMTVAGVSWDDLLISQDEFKKRRKNKKAFKANNQTPWQEIFRNTVGQLDDGACINSRGKYLDVSHTKGLPRDSH